MPWFNSDGPPKSEVSNFQIAKSCDLLIFKLWIRNLFWLTKSIEARGLMLFIYVLNGCNDEIPQKSTKNSDTEAGILMPRATKG